MTQNELQQIAKLLSARAELSGRKLSADAILTLASDVSDLPFAEVAGVLQKWGRLWGAQFPDAAKIRQSIESVAEKDPNEIAGAIIGCVRRFGWTNPERAREAMGPEGWLAVEKFGGWQMLCESLNDDNLGQTRAQLRDMAGAVNRSTARQEIAKGLPQNADVLRIVNSAFKQLEKT